MNELVWLLMVGFLVGLSVGLWWGSYLEARLWRGKSASGFRMASGGKLYRVEQEK